MSADMEGWEVIQKDPWSANGSAPQLMIYADGSGRLNAPADRALDQPDGIQFLVKPDDALVGITAAENLDALDVYSVTREEFAGGDIRPRQALERAGVDVDAIDEKRTIDLERDGDLLVADCTKLLEDAATRTGDRALDATTPAADDDEDDEEEDDSDKDFVCDPCGCEFEDADVYEGHMNDVHSEDVGTDEAEDDDMFECQYCTDTFDSERGRNIHEGRMHDDEDELAPEDVELPGSLTEADVHAVADFLDSIEAVANDFEVSVDRAERILRAHDCLGEVSR